MDPEWKTLDFQREVRPEQLNKLEGHQNEVQAIGETLQRANNSNMAQIDHMYKDTAQLEEQFITKKLENTNLINESEMEGVKFLHQFGESSREQESLTAQISQIQQIIAMLSNEQSLADVETYNMDKVYDKEQELVTTRDTMIKENDRTVTADLQEQGKDQEAAVKQMEEIQAKQSTILDGLSAKQQQVLNDFEKRNQKLEDERIQLEAEEEELQGKIRNSRKENEARKNKSQKLGAEVDQLTLKVEIMEDNIDKIIEDNLRSFDQYQEIVSTNNANIDKMREDLGNVQKQHFEMENINESLEQRIDQLKGQRDLSVQLTVPGQQIDLEAQQDEANLIAQKWVDLLNNTEQNWQDTLVQKIRELDDHMRQASDESINQQVQTYSQQVRDKNHLIIKITQAKEEIESKMLQEVSDTALINLQGQHSELIKQYEGIIKDKIVIFTQMIANLKILSQGNGAYVQKEELIADKKLAIEIWDRDIYQKKRVNLDVQMNIQTIMAMIEDTEKEIADRRQRIAELEGELEESAADLAEFKSDVVAKDARISELEQQIEELLADRARLEAAAEAERLRLEEELRNRPKLRVKYVPVKGDKTDERMAIYMNNFDLDVPMIRQGEGNYIFGSRKIFAKIMNEKLVIRVGGGFMLIEEFLPTYGQQELDKINQKDARAIAATIALATQGSAASLPGAGKALGSPARRGSPNANQFGKAIRNSPNANRGSPTAAKRMAF